MRVLQSLCERGKRRTRVRLGGTNLLAQIQLLSSPGISTAHFFTVTAGWPIRATLHLNPKCYEGRLFSNTSFLNTPLALPVANLSLSLSLSPFRAPRSGSFPLILVCFARLCFAQSPAQPRVQDSVSARASARWKLPASDFLRPNTRRQAKLWKVPFFRRDGGWGWGKREGKRSSGRPNRTCRGLERGENKPQKFNVYPRSRIWLMSLNFWNYWLFCHPSRVFPTLMFSSPAAGLQDSVVNHNHKFISQAYIR